MDVEKRLLEIAAAVGLKNLNQLAREINCTRGNITHLVNSGRLNEPFISRLRLRYPELSERFIRHGEGEVLDPARQAEIDREAVISLILRNFARLEPEAQEIILESARRHLAAAEKKNDASREGGADLENLRRIG